MYILWIKELTYSIENAPVEKKMKNKALFISFILISIEIYLSSISKTYDFSKLFIGSSKAILIFLIPKYFAHLSIITL